MEEPIAGSLRLSPDVAETLRKSHRVSGLVGAVLGALHPPYGAIGSQDWRATFRWAAAYLHSEAGGFESHPLRHN
jgi:hypothetical protein